MRQVAPASLAADAAAPGANRTEQSAQGAPIALSAPIGLAESKTGLLYVGNHGGTCPPCQVLVYNAAGVQQTSKTITKGLDNPAGLAFDSSGKLYVANYSNQTVTVYSSTGKQIVSRTMHTDPNYNPSGVQVDDELNVWVANRTNNNIGIGEIQVFNKSGAVIHTITSNLVYPLGIVFAGSTEDAWVGNSETPNDAMTVYDASGNFVKKVSTRKFVPTYLAIRTGKLYVTDGLDSELKVFSMSGSVSKTIKAGLDLPYGIAFNAAGDFYVANVGNNTITEYNSAGTLIKTIH
jgi:sugar lactone lactonase YvrE